MSGGVSQILALAAEATSGGGSTAAETTPPVPPEAEVAAAEREGSDEAIRTQAMQVRVHASGAPRIATGRREAHVGTGGPCSLLVTSCSASVFRSSPPYVDTWPGFHVASLPLSQLKLTAPSKARATARQFLFLNESVERPAPFGETAREVCFSVGGCFELL